MPKASNFAFRNAAAVCPERLKGGVALWGWCRRSAAEGSVSQKFVFSIIVLPSTQALWALDIFYSRKTSAELQLMEHLY